MRLMIAAVTLLASVPALAEVAIIYPVAIPQECFELAQREGVPKVIQNETQGRRAQVKLAQMRDSPLVRDCRSAVARARQQFENQRASQ